MPTRWSSENRYDNPSVYCEDIKEVFEYIWSRIEPDLQVKVEGVDIPIKEALED
ncbi:hypothetical protein F6Y05_02445 [Bacillus megaterium]|nr:hypothetical protein [Priestia megaterium]